MFRVRIPRWARGAITIRGAQILQFVFFAAVAFGTIIGDPIGDRLCCWLVISVKSLPCYFVGRDQTDLTAEIKMIQFNCVSQVHLTKRILPGMVERGSGKLLYTASISGTMPTPYEAVDGGTKAFLISFVESVKEENKASGVSFTLLMPGEVDTPFWHRAGMDTTALGLGEKAAPTKVAKDGYDAMAAGKDRVVSRLYEGPQPIIPKPFRRT